MSPQRTSGWVGWIWFSAIIMITVGMFNALDGIVAAFSDKTWVVVGGGELVLFDVSTWGWIHLIIGIILVAVGFLLIAGKKWARWLAVVLVVINCLTQFAVMPVTPWWSLVTITLDMFILWALIVHGHEIEE